MSTAIYTTWDGIEEHSSTVVVGYVAMTWINLECQPLGDAAEPVRIVLALCTVH